MKLSSLDIAYQLQKKYLDGKEVVAYKVGASNFRSADFFNYSGILLGGIQKKNIFYSSVPRNYPTAEIEIISKVLFDDQGYKIISQFIGVECPDLTVQNPNGLPFVCVADNCAAGDLLIFQEIEDDYFKHVKVLCNGDLLMKGSSEQLRFTVDEIVSKTVKLIQKNLLPVDTNELLIATGGLTDVFSLESGDQLEIICE